MNRGVALSVLGLALCIGCSPSAPDAGAMAGGAGAAVAGRAGASGATGASGMATGGASGATALGGAGGSGGVAGDDCQQAPETLLCKPLAALPASIRQTGLFPAAPDLRQRSARLISYVPDPPLWSDGMSKERLLLLPVGTKIDNSDRAHWGFPDGTILVKTFFDDGGAGGAKRAVETRLIRLATGGVYEFFIYQWNADGSDATLVLNDIDGDVNADILVPVTVSHMDDGQPLVVNGGQPFMHTLPSRNACGKCHEQNGMVAQTLIGFDELRLNAKLTPDAAKTQLQTLADAGIFSGAAPADAASIADASNDGGRLLRIKRFVFGNCVHCHNGGGQVDLHPDVFVQNTVSKPTEAQSVMPPAGWLRVVPGDPSKSVLYVQMQRTMLPAPTGDGMNRLRAMPPLGVADVAADQAALEDVADWITALPH